MAATITGSGGYGLISSATLQNSTSGTSIDFSSIPSGVKRITLIMSAVSTNGSSIPIVQVGAGSITTTGYVSLGVGTAGAGLGSTTATNGFILRDAWDSAKEGKGTITLVTPGNNIWIATYLGMAGASGASTGFYGAGSVTLGGTLDRVRLTTSNGTDTFDAGSVNILYE